MPKRDEFMKRYDKDRDYFISHYEVKDGFLKIYYYLKGKTCLRCKCISYSWYDEIVILDEMKEQLILNSIAFYRDIPFVKRFGYMTLLIRASVTQLTFSKSLLDDFDKHYLFLENEEVINKNIQSKILHYGFIFDDTLCPMLLFNANANINDVRDLSYNEVQDLIDGNFGEEMIHRLYKEYQPF